VSPHEQHSVNRDELAAYALGALEPGEVDALERHLTGCNECREYLFWLDPAVDVLPASVEQREAPRRLKGALMAEVREDIKAARRAERDRARADRGIWGTIWRPVTVVAACLVLVAGVIGGYALRGDDETEPGSIAATLEREGDSGTLHVEALPVLPDNRVYQAWIQRDGKMVPSTTFVVSRDGAKDVVIAGSLDGASGVYVTREPAGGSEEPTLPVIIEAPLT
jgi:anti-sigma-K factor RskA